MPNNFSRMPNKFFTLIGCLERPVFWLVVISGKFKFIGHSTEIIPQSKIKGPLFPKEYCTLNYYKKQVNFGMSNLVRVLKFGVVLIDIVDIGIPFSTENAPAENQTGRKKLSLKSRVTQFNWNKPHWKCSKFPYSSEVFFQLEFYI